MRILLAVDGSPFSEDAISEVARRPWPPASEVKVVTAFQVPLIATPDVWSISQEYLPALEQLAREQSQSIVDAAVARLTSLLDKAISVEGEVLIGVAREAILERAESWHADLIVMGSHGYGAWRGFLLGSVSQAVIANARCSVEIVHRRENHEDEKAA
jgi:nucleotide-binding universal stress UspA family protein